MKSIFKITAAAAAALVSLASVAFVTPAFAADPDAGPAPVDGGAPPSDGGAPPDAGPAPAPAPESPPPPPPPPAPSERARVAPTVDVLAQRPRRTPLDEVAGSTAVLSKQDLVNSTPVSSADALRQVTGINYVPEEGMGLRPNVGLRGLDPSHSRKVLFLEDGVPISLNPYGTPESYYAPPIERMQRVDVVKGSGQILNGPQTVGASIDFISRDPPRKLTLEGDLRYGTYGYLVAQAGVGNTHGPFGYWLEVLHRRFDGPRALDLALTDVFGKVRIAISPRSLLTLKLDVYDEFSRATYLGLTRPQYEADPNGSYAIHDRVRIRRYAVSARHTQLLARGVQWTNTAYGYLTDRDWRRQDYLRSHLDKNGNPLPADLFERAVGATPGAPATDDGGSIWFLRTTGNVDRAYAVAGLDSRATWGWASSTRPVSGELVAGARFHYERARDQLVQGATPEDSSGNIAEDEIRHGYALALFAQHRLSIKERLHITPGLRLENFWTDRTVLRRRPLVGDTLGPPESVFIRGGSFAWGIIPGLGLAYDPHPVVRLYAGVHRGFAPPRTKDAVTPMGQDLRLDAELSWNWELGARVRLGRALAAEVTGFLLDFSRYLLPIGEASTTPESLATYAARTAGVEVNATFDPMALTRHGAAWSLPITVNYTAVPLATFVGGGFDGLRLPYAPEHLLYAQIRLQHRLGLSAQVAVTYLGPQFSDMDNTVVDRGPNGQAGLIGKLDGYALLDARVAWTIAKAGVTLYVAGKNLTNTRYIAGRDPAGIAPGLPLQVWGGVSFSLPPRPSQTSARLN
jgi:Fe(3+) dicitrate transport protein